MLILYIKSNCLYCDTVIKAIRGLGLPFESRNIADDERRQELLVRTGKDDVPYLIDEENKVSLSGSHDIIQHIRGAYGNKEHRSWNTV